MRKIAARPTDPITKLFTFMNPTITGKNIELYRRQLQMTQENLSVYLGINRTQIAYYENGNRPVPLKHIHNLADLFGVEIMDLIEENAEQTQVSVALAFRADTLQAEDLQSIASFRTIVRNYLKLKKL